MSIVPVKVDSGVLAETFMLGNDPLLQLALELERVNVGSACEDSETISAVVRKFDLRASNLPEFLNFLWRSIACGCREGSHATEVLSSAVAKCKALPLPSLLGLLNGIVDISECSREKAAEIILFKITLLGSPMSLKPLMQSLRKLLFYFNDSNIRPRAISEVVRLTERLVCNRSEADWLELLGALEDITVRDVDKYDVVCRIVDDISKRFHLPASAVIIVQRILDKINQRISKEERELVWTSKLNIAEYLHISAFAQKIIQESGVTLTEPRRFKHSEHDLPRTVTIFAGGDWVIHLKNKNGLSKVGSGRYKKVYNALGYIGVQLTQVADIVLINCTTEQIAKIKMENMLAREIGSDHVVGASIYEITYKSEKSGRVQNKVALISKLYQALSTGIIYEMSLEDRIRVLLGVSKGLADIHAKGYVHGDVKVANFLGATDRDGKITGVIADLGFCFKIDHCVGYRGTPFYSAPELCNAACDPCDRSYQGISTPSDIWSLGIAFYAALYTVDDHCKKYLYRNGWTPEYYSERMNIQQKDLNTCFKCPPSYDPRNNAETRLLKCIRRMVRADPSGRWTAQQVVGELEDILFNLVNS